MLFEQATDSDYTSAVADSYMSTSSRIELPWLNSYWTHCTDAQGKRQCNSSSHFVWGKDTLQWDGNHCRWFAMKMGPWYNQERRQCTGGDVTSARSKAASPLTQTDCGMTMRLHEQLMVTQTLMQPTSQRCLN